MTGRGVVGQAQQALRGLWDSTPNLNRPGLFDGGLADLSCLDYLDYEGISYAGLGASQYVGEQVVALVFGEVLVRQAGFVWLVDEHGGDVHSYDEQNSRFCVWPHARYREMARRNHPQFGRHSQLAAWVLHECLLTAALKDETEAKFNAILEELGFAHWRIAYD